MKLTIHAPQEINRHLKHTIHEKIEKLEMFSDQIIHIDVFLKDKVNSGMDDKEIEIRVRVSGPELFANGYADTFEKAMAKTTDKIKKQLIKRKEILEEKHPKH